MMPTMPPGTVSADFIRYFFNKYQATDVQVLRILNKAAHVTEIAKEARERFCLSLSLRRI